MPVLAVAIALLTPSTASAQGEAITLSPTQGPVNTPVTVHGTGWQDYFSRGLDVPINIGTQQLADAHPDSNGEFTVTITIPASTPPGVTRIDAILGNGGSASASFTVTESGSVPPSPEEEPSVPPLDLTPGESAGESAQLRQPTVRPAVSATECTKVQPVYVPGYNDKTAGNWVIDEVTRQLKQELPSGVDVLGLGDKDELGVREYEIPYPSREGGTATPTDETATNKGATELKSRLEKASKDTCFVLIGYSTGVIVIEKALWSLDDPELSSRILAVELFADPKSWPRLAWGADVPSGYAERTAYWTNPTDPLANGFDLLGPRQLDEWRACAHAVATGGDIVVCFTPAHLPGAYAPLADDAARHVVCVVTDTCEVTTVSDGDTLWDLAQRFLGRPSLWRSILDAGRAVIEEAARRHGFESSDNGHWIFPGTNLLIPSAG
ncbi:LysM peptidoglycan-binding domain-containing protein [Streptomyces sp. NPDC086843]|uniref:LysM peptidoglycan-binding domain-containing protein n=1 Tax=Streptomyces sp. NPDC086843 TaxID=3365763 RepID=UPI00382C8F30